MVQINYFVNKIFTFFPFFLNTGCDTSRKSADDGSPCAGACCCRGNAVCDKEETCTSPHVQKQDYSSCVYNFDSSLLYVLHVNMDAGYGV